MQYFKGRISLSGSESSKQRIRGSLLGSIYNIGNESDVLKKKPTTNYKR